MTRNLGPRTSRKFSGTLMVLGVLLILAFATGEEDFSLAALGFGAGFMWAMYDRRPPREDYT